MQQVDKIERLEGIDSEDDVRKMIQALLKKMGFEDIRETHRYGQPEYGKDILAKHSHPIEGQEWYAFVVKHGRVRGNTNAVETTKNQVKQCFEYDFTKPNGDNVRVNKVVVASNGNITGGAQDVIGSSDTTSEYSNIAFWDRDQLIHKIDDHYPSYWSPEEQSITEFSKGIRSEIQEDIETKNISGVEVDGDSVRSLLSIYIEPTLIEVDTADVRSGDSEPEISEHKLSVSEVQSSSDNFIVSGDPGAGKTRLVEEIAYNLSESNRVIKKSVLPITLSAKSIGSNDYDIESAVKSRVHQFAPSYGNEIDLSEYDKVLLIDSVDFLSRGKKEMLMKRLEGYTEDNNARFIIATRKSEFFDIDDVGVNYRNIKIPNFGRQKCEKFIESFFDEEDTSDKLLTTLKETNLLEKMPTTPLTISLLSILFDQKDNKEIPATQADLYEEFTEILLGRLQVSNVLELMELNYLIRAFRDVSLQMLEEGETELNISEFTTKMNEFLERKGKEALDVNETLTLVEDTGFMYRDSKNNVGFKHSSFMEYFASADIFNHRRPEYEPVLIDKFDEPHWQNTAVFFAGISNDLPIFVDKLLAELNPSSIDDLNVFIGGLGYLSQAQYQLDPEPHTSLVKRATDYAYQLLLSLEQASEDQESFLHDVKPHALVLLVAYWFRFNFSSITLVKPLRNAYDQVASEITDDDNFEKSFKLFLLSSTLTHKYIGDGSKLYELTESKCFSNTPIIVLSSALFFDNITLPGSEPDQQIGDNIQHHASRFEDVFDYFLDTPIRKLESPFVSEEE